MNLKSLLAVAALSVPSLASAAGYEVDTAHSSAGFTVKHMMVSNVKGEFAIRSATLTLDEKDPKKSVVEATLDAASVDTGNEKRDAHLKSADFFDTAKFPTIAFKSTEVKKVGKGKFQVKGDLTMHGVTKAVVLAVESADTEVKDPWGNTKRGAVATTTINRKDFGLTYNAALESGGVVVGEDVRVTLELELNRKPEQSASAK
ncbi:MAG: YceI family protein [Myxococcaceae bacterium]|nr:YceI family protein [Myxococcaceae bacterium]MCI0671058.1 YceI family protein [Myxococcaceae bacterium]